MKAIIISDADSRALLDKLELANMRAEPNSIMREDMTRPPTVADIHRVFHYVVCRWLQEQGADVSGR